MYVFHYVIRLLLLIFVDGPTSRLDTIELTGFKDDIRNEIRDKSKKTLPAIASLPNPLAKTTQSNGFAAIDSAAMLSISYSSDEKVNKHFYLFYRNNPKE